MSANRLLGQDVQVLVVVDGELQTSLGPVQSCEIGKSFEQKDEGFIGEKTNRKDQVLTGATFRMTGQPETAGFFDFITLITELARRDVPSRVVNVIFVMDFPDGTTARVTVFDASFGNIPLSFGSRTEFGTWTLEGTGSDYQAIT